METDKEAPRTVYPLQLILATGLYSGYLPWASGTAGSLVGVLIYLIPGVETPTILLPSIVAFLLLGARAAANVAKVKGNRLTKTAAAMKSRFSDSTSCEADPSIVVIDEIVGMWISLFYLPKTLPAIALAFVLFRVFDIVKPFPVRNLERIPHGWGIMLDDLAAGLYANLVCRITLSTLGW
jgi:phosphatidylglycerophosphatase A